MSDETSASSGAREPEKTEARRAQRETPEHLKSTRVKVPETWKRLVETRDGIYADQALRRAALNLLEDTELARRREEEETASRERAEAALAGEKEYAEKIVETLHEPLLVLHPDLTVRSVNAAFYTHFNVSPGNTIGRKIYELGNGQWNIPELRRLLEDVLPDSKVFSDHEVTHDFHTLGRRVMLLNGRRLDHMQLILLGIRDITDRKRAEDALRAREARMRTLADAVPQIIWTNDGHGRANYFNKRWYEYSGLTFEQSVGLGWEAIVHPEDAAASKERWQRAQAEGEIFDTEYRLRDAEGEYRWFIARNVPTREPGDDRVTGWFGTATDIEALKEAEAAAVKSEEQLRLVLENAHEYAIFSTDLERRVTSWYSGAQAILGYSPSEMLGQSADIVFTPEDRAAGAPEREAEIALRVGRATDERWHVRKDGTQFWGSGAMTVMRNRSGGAVGLLKIFRDHTQAKQNAEVLQRSRAELESAFLEMQRAREEAEVANRTKDRFLAMLSHELRTPLTPVLGAAESILRQKDLSARTREGLEMICRNVELQTRLINDLLDLTRIARGTLELARRRMNLHAAVKAAVEISMPEIEQKGQKLILELKAKEQVVNADVDRIQQVFWNVLKNASKYTPEKGKICVTSRDEPGAIVVEISDSGMGIDAKALPHIFEAFRQADTSIARRFGGLGLGLAIAKATVDAHGGSIVASSAGAGAGYGATFVVRLPLEEQ